MRKNQAGGLVYSTDSGRTCPTCRQAIADCRCGARTAAPAGDGIVRIELQTKGRGGKAVTVIRGLVATPPATIDAIAKQLRSACGSGGTVKDGVVEIQGDHRDRVIALLSAQGMKVKRSGG
ncbi:translation initiation factor Sui1 [Piscinibacter sakaiensis]|uniref:translation initiation factor Sui1 n=1 Tax=Piscinibacter sakaiensis TaxID=1547922 RepID=UPI003AB03C19